jgi:hypothetical protein
MNRIIDRTWINPDIQWYQVDSNFNVDHVSDYDEIAASIDHWKNILVEQANVGPGSTVALSLTQRDLRWISILFAIWELGASYAIQPRNYPKANSPFAAAIVDSEESALAQKELANTVIMLDIWDHYVSSNVGDLQKNNPAIEHNSALLRSISLTPELDVDLVEYSHAFSHEHAHRCVNIFDFKSDDRVMHMHGTQHGGGIINMLLPSLKACKHHYGVISHFDHLPQITDLVEREGITKITMPDSITTERFIQRAIPFTKPVHIITMQGNQSNWIPFMKQNNVESSTSSFGSADMYGPVLVNRLTKDADSSFNCMNFGFPLDDFYKVSLTDDNRLRVEHKDRGTVIFDDTFTLTDTGYVFEHRRSFPRINDVIFSIRDLDDIVNQTTNPSLVYLLPDSTLNQIYLLLDHAIGDSTELVDKLNAELGKKISPQVQINHVDQQDISKFKARDDFNEFQIRNHFRNKFKFR